MFYCHLQKYDADLCGKVYQRLSEYLASIVRCQPLEVGTDDQPPEYNSELNVLVYAMSLRFRRQKTTLLMGRIPL